LDDATLIDISFNFDSQHLALEVQKRAPDTGALFRDFLAYAKKIIQDLRKIVPARRVQRRWGDFT
jgi:hypothetical protein